MLGAPETRNLFGDTTAEETRGYKGVPAPTGDRLLVQNLVEDEVWLFE